MDSKVKQRRSVTAHSSSGSARSIPASQTREARFGKDAHHRCPSLHLLVHPLQGVRGVKAPTMLLREALVGQHVFRGLLEELRGSGEPGPEPVGHPAELGHAEGWSGWAKI